MPAHASSSARTASPAPDLASAARVANLDTGTTARTHLSVDGVSLAYPERVLRDWPGIVIFASHDRTPLDAVATKVLDLDPLPVAARELGDDSADGAGDALTGEDPGSGLGVRLWGGRVLGGSRGAGRGDAALARTLHRRAGGARVARA